MPSGPPTFRMSTLWNELRLAVRTLSRSPAFAVTAVLILGIGIGMAVAMFTVFRAVLVRRLPVVDQDRLVVLWTTVENGVEQGGVKPSIAAFGRESRTVKAIAGVSHWGSSPLPLIDGERTIVLNQALVNGNFFNVLGARPALGRLLTTDDELGGKFQPDTYKGLEHAIVISYATWLKEFGGDSSVIGHRLLDAYSRWTYTIVGVAPPGLDYPAGTEDWLPIGKDATDVGIVALARLRPGVSLSAARFEYQTVLQRLTPDFHVSGAVARTLPDQVLGNVRPALVILIAAVGLLLLVACVDVANLLLLRAADRARELAIRRAIGASSGDVVRQLVVESTVLAAAGGLLGLGCALVLLRALLALAPAELPRTDVIQVSGPPVAVAAVITLAAVLLFGVVPALMAARADLAAPLRLDSRSGSESPARRRMRECLVGAQVALALVMVTGAGLLSHSLARLQSLDLGYDPDHLAYFAILVPMDMINTQPRIVTLGDALLPRLRAVPGVRSVTPVIVQPLLGPNIFLWAPVLEGQAPSEANLNPLLAVEDGNPDYFRTFDIRFIRGRGFSTDGPGAPLEAVVSEAAARRLWPGADPIGKRIRYPFLPDSGWRTVVGVVHDIHLRSMREVTPTVFLQWRYAFWQGIFAVRTAGRFASVLPGIRSAVHDIDPSLGVWATGTMDEYLAGPLAEPRLNALLLSGFGLVALLLAAMGLYGVMAAAVRQRTHDMGVRMALGATAGRLRREVLGAALSITTAGTVAGLVVAIASSRALSAVLFDVSPTDPLTLCGACIVVLGVGLAAAYLPARWATRIDPVRALRRE